MSTLKALWPVVNQFQNKNGSILTSGRVYVYYKNRTTLAEIFSDEEGTVVRPNPVLLDNNGRATVFADTAYSYTIVVCDYYGKELFSQDITLHDVTETADEITLIGSDGSININTSSSNGVKTFDMSANTDILATKKSVDDVKTDLNTLTGTVNNHTTQIGQIQEDINGIDSVLANKKDKQNELNFNGSATKTVKKITQNANGELNVEFENIDLPQEVPNVEITSEDYSVKVTETTDTQTNTKKFDLSVDVDKSLFIIDTDAITDFIDITNEWQFANGFNLTPISYQPNNSMTIKYSPTYNLVRFFGECRITRSNSWNDTNWVIFLRYTGDRFYTTYNVSDILDAPYIYPKSPFINLIAGLNSSGWSNTVLLRPAYIGSPGSSINDTGLAVKQNVNISTNYGISIKDIVLEVTPKNA